MIAAVASAAAVAVMIAELVSRMQLLAEPTVKWEGRRRPDRACPVSDSTT